MSISASEARKTPFPLSEQVDNDHTVVEISSRSGDVVLMSADDYRSWQETVYLLRYPANAARLMRAVAAYKAGETVEKTMDELYAAADGEG
ncbi:type II toxin-antitoxin system Phd/YefM family antitoxin [Streptomyces sp. NPDC048481]|uniref:type II toxin-antitoxin system Phd/YefM family antitoxin n=1 Tax=Streptomyces sp. NPDC048481 TaxID=3365557 RepID=UPI0037144244